MEKRESLKNQILDAAWERFTHYGFGKTTMAEISRDCNMSPANLYRYFESKADIGAGLAVRCFKGSEEELRKVLKKPGISATKRLEVFTIELLRFNFNEFASKENVMELVEYIGRERWDLVKKRIDTLNSFIAEILAEGNKTGEFDVLDIVATAGQIRIATIKFHAPHFLLACKAECTLKELEDEVKSVISLITKGIAGK